jgi:hypothetical protein
MCFLPFLGILQDLDNLHANRVFKRTPQHFFERL